MNLYNDFMNYKSGPLRFTAQHCGFLEGKLAINPCTLLLHRYALQLSLVTPAVCNVGSLAPNQLKELQKLNTHIIVMMTEKAMNYLQLHLVSLLKRKS